MVIATITEAWVALESLTVLQVSVALVYLFVGVAVGRFIARLLITLDDDETLKQGPFGSLPVGHGAARVAERVLIVLAGVAALAELNLASVVFRIVFVLLGLFALLAGIIALKDWTVNAVAGWMFGFKGRYVVGTWIHIGSLKARITALERTQLVTETQDGDRLEIPATFALWNLKGE